MYFILNHLMTKGETNLNHLPHQDVHVCPNVEWFYQGILRTFGSANKAEQMPWDGGSSALKTGNHPAPPLFFF